MKLCTASSCPSATALAGRPRFCFSSGAQPSVRQQPRLRHPPIWHGLAGPEHAALLVTTVRAALLPVHHYLPRAAARLLSVCVKAVRFPAGAWPPHHGRAALPRPGQAGPGLLRLLPAGGGHRMTCRAGLRGLLRGAPPVTGLPGHESAVAAPAATCASPRFSFVAGAHFQPYMSVPTGPTWGGAGFVSRVSRDSLILTLYHGRDQSAGGRTQSVWPACRATMRVIGWTRPTMGAPQHAGWGGTLMYGWK